MTLMTIGEFAERTRLSPKALRLYDHRVVAIPESLGAAQARPAWAAPLR